MDDADLCDLCLEKLATEEIVIVTEGVFALTLSPPMRVCEQCKEALGDDQN